MTQTPVIYWLRRDLRLDDNPALCAAMAQGRPVIPVYIHDETVPVWGAAARLRLDLALKAFAERLEEVGSRLILRRGDTFSVLQDLIVQTNATSLVFAKLYEPQAIALQSRLTDALTGQGITVAGHAGHLLCEPDSVLTKAGEPFRVFTPMWKALRQRDIGQPLAAPSAIPAPKAWPATDTLQDWRLAQDMQRGARVVAGYARPGEAAAQARLDAFIDHRLKDYAHARDFPAMAGTSDLSEHLTLGEISPRRCWQRGWQALEQGVAGAETFLKELTWREFAHQLMLHTPHILERNWKRDWDGFGWRRDAGSDDFMAWCQGRTGEPFVDAAMRELYTTGRMHNRARMIAASYLTKHLLIDWRLGQEWFADCLIDWDPASNAMGWQWVAGSGPDAAPFFRIFNPRTQIDRFDPKRAYTRHWIAELADVDGEDAGADALAFYDACPRRWGLSPDDPYPAPRVDLAAGRARALTAYQDLRADPA